MDINDNSIWTKWKSASGHILTNETMWSGNEQYHISWCAQCLQSCWTVEEAKNIMASMNDAGISPQIMHLTCMADVFGRAGQLDEAESILN